MSVGPATGAGGGLSISSWRGQWREHVSGVLCAMGGGEFTLSPNVTVGAEDHGVHNVLANWTRQQVVSPGSRHGQRAWADIQGVCKHGDA